MRIVHAFIIVAGALISKAAGSTDCSVNPEIGESPSNITAIFNKEVGNLLYNPQSTTVKDHLINKNEILVKDLDENKEQENKLLLISQNADSIEKDQYIVWIEQSTGYIRPVTKNILVKFEPMCKVNAENEKTLKTPVEIDIYSKISHDTAVEYLKSLLSTYIYDLYKQDRDSYIEIKDELYDKIKDSTVPNKESKKIIEEINSIINTNAKIESKALGMAIKTEKEKVEEILFTDATDRILEVYKNRNRVESEIEKITVLIKKLKSISIEHIEDDTYKALENERLLELKQLFKTNTPLFMSMVKALVNNETEREWLDGLEDLLQESTEYIDNILDIFKRNHGLYKLERIFIGNSAITPYANQIIALFKNHPEILKKIKDLFQNTHMKIDHHLFDQTLYMEYINTIDYNTILNLYKLLELFKKLRETVEFYNEIWEYPIEVRYKPAEQHMQEHIYIKYMDETGHLNKIRVEPTDKNIEAIIAAKKIEDIKKIPHHVITDNNR